MIVIADLLVMIVIIMGIAGFFAMLHELWLGIQRWRNPSADQDDDEIW